ncbi:unnamed protein product [Adineta steineri]|uniref:Uncharacterized protein n=1 Tax=Adineta steineri TaxID=433720 RepID=A0A814W8I3_9BILA|nr:unnamed protein product [Adineta steineri]CAF1201694.1 unnamed protein product [Adineta steineri]
MVDSIQSSQSSVLHEEIEAYTRQIIMNYLQENSVSFPDKYFTRMVKTGFLDKFITMMETESVKQDKIKKMLNKHNISIPSEFYSGMVRTNLLEHLLNATHNIDSGSDPNKNERTNTPTNDTDKRSTAKKQKKVHICSTYEIPLAHNQQYLYKRAITYEEAQQLLKKPFPWDEKIKNENHRINQCHVNAGTTDIHALQTIINDQCTMISNLINNSVNATFVANAIYNYHSKTGPILTSWRDLIDLFFITFFVSYLVYYRICSIGFHPCDKIMAFCCKPVILRIQNQQQQQKEQEPTTTTIINENPVPKKAQHRQLSSSVAFVEDDYFVRFNNGYISE